MQQKLPILIAVAQKPVSLSVFGSISCGREDFKKVSINFQIQNKIWDAYFFKFHQFEFHKICLLCLGAWNCIFVFHDTSTIWPLKSQRRRWIWQFSSEIWKFRNQIIIAIKLLISIGSKNVILVRCLRIYPKRHIGQSKYNSRPDICLILKQQTQNTDSNFFLVILICYCIIISNDKYLTVKNAANEEVF